MNGLAPGHHPAATVRLDPDAPAASAAGEPAPRRGVNPSAAPQAAAAKPAQPAAHSGTVVGKRLRLPRGAKAAAVLAACALAIPLLATAAPHDYSRVVPAHSVHWSSSGSPCAIEGGIVALDQVNDAGPYPLYNATCANGTNVLAAHP